MHQLSRTILSRLGRRGQPTTRGWIHPAPRTLSTTAFTLGATGGKSNERTALQRSVGAPFHFYHAPRMTCRRRRLFSSTIKDLPVKILYASQGGTAQLFAMQLSEALEELAPTVDATIHGLHEESPTQLLQPGKALHVFLASTAGVGEPPDNARGFYDWLTKEANRDQPSSGGVPVLKGLDYTVFGLGNKKAHPNHYNFIGKGLDEKINALGGNRIYPLGLGDDGDCLEDDYDRWMESMIQTVYRGQEGTVVEEEAQASRMEHPEAAATPATAVVEDSNITLEPCVGAKAGQRLISAKYERLQLTPTGSDASRDDLLHLSDRPFYTNGTVALDVLTNRPLNPHAGENGLYELRVSLEDSGLTYETGDHLMVYPQNSDTMVEAYLQHMDVDPHVRIEVSTQDSRYPHPTGVTLTETLRHCVDLSAVPSPNVARLFTGRQQIDYKNEIASPRRTVLDLLASATRSFALEEILYNLPPMKARYYSIASSSLVHPKQAYLVYRPVQYTTTRGHLRMGVATSYLKNMMGITTAGDCTHSDDDIQSSQLLAAVNSNPTFRLPADRKTAVLFIAGGCGIAPIRAFLEERIHIRSATAATSTYSDDALGEGCLFLGFRSPTDAPYKSLVRRAFQCGAISSLHITFNGGCSAGSNLKLLGDLQAHTSCGLVSDAVGEHGEQLYSFFERQGCTYICGGARLFGVAIENQIHSLLQNHGNLSETEATRYLQKMLEDGRLNEDLSD